MLARNPNASEPAKKAITNIIENHKEMTYEKHIDVWDTFFVIKKDQPAGNLQTWNARAGPSNSQNYLKCI